jgi:hypothetical protein
MEYQLGPLPSSRGSPVLLLGCLCFEQDFSEAEHAHERFLHALVTQSFLGHSAIVKQIGEVFGQTRALCRLVRGARERGIDCDAVTVSCSSVAAIE